MFCFTQNLAHMYILTRYVTYLVDLLWKSAKLHTCAHRHWSLKFSLSDSWTCKIFISVEFVWVSLWRSTFECTRSSYCVSIFSFVRNASTLSAALKKSLQRVHTVKQGATYNMMYLVYSVFHLKPLWLYFFTLWFQWLDCVVRRISFGTHLDWKCVSFLQLREHLIPWTSTSWRGALFVSCGLSVTPPSVGLVSATSLSRIWTRPSTTRPCTTPSPPSETSSLARSPRTHPENQRVIIYEIYVITIYCPPKMMKQR